MVSLYEMCQFITLYFFGALTTQEKEVLCYLSEVWKNQTYFCKLYIIYLCVWFVWWYYVQCVFSIARNPFKVLKVGLGSCEKKGREI